MNDIQRVTVLGAGDMGHGIAEVALLAGMDVILRDIEESSVQRGRQRILDSLDVFLRKERISAEQREEMTGRLATSTDLAAAVAAADLVIEAIPEVLELKLATFREMDGHAPAHCLFASNTSTMSVTAMGAATARPDRVAGLHYFNPAVLMATVEVIRTEATSEATFDALFDYCLRCGKSPVRVEKDTPGFIVNRVQSMAGILVGAWLDAGEDPETIDAVVRSRLGTPMGPCETSDYAGLDIGYHGANYYARTLHPDHAPSRTKRELYEQGHYGKKTGRGLFDWSNGRPHIDLGRSSDRVVVEDMLLVNANEALRLVEMGVATPADIQQALIGATGNPAGIFSLLQGFEPAAVTARLEELAQSYGKEVFQPCALLRAGAYKEFAL